MPLRKLKNPKKKYYIGIKYIYNFTNMYKFVGFKTAL